MRKILNLTQHKASVEQKNEGVFDIEGATELDIVKDLLTIHAGDNPVVNAKQLSDIAKMYGVKYAMIGGAQFLMNHLEKFLVHYGITPLYAFSERVAIDLPNGEKKSVFKHRGWYTADGEFLQTGFKKENYGRI